MILPPPSQYRKSRRPVRFGAPPPTPPVNPVLIIVVLAGSTTADWVFDQDIVAVSNTAPLKIAGVSPDAVEFVQDNILRVSYFIDIEVGMPWSYDGTPVASFANGGVLQPASGTTQEG
jgi:hypothetical protein